MSYQLENLHLADEDVLDQVGGPDNWPMVSSVNQNLQYEFVEEEPFEYFDFNQRYRVKISDDKQSKDQPNKEYLALLCRIDNCGSSELMEDLLADFELLKGQSSRWGDQIQVFDDICVDWSPQSDHMNLTLIHQKIDGIPMTDEHTLSIKRAIDQMDDKSQVIPLVQRIIQFISKLRDAYYYEFEISNHNLVVFQKKNNRITSNQFDFMLVNQSLPLLYRQIFQSVNNQIYDEEEYEMNNILLLKKVASFLVTIGLGGEPAKHGDMISMLQEWKSKKQSSKTETPIHEHLIQVAYVVVINYMNHKKLEETGTPASSTLPDKLITLAQIIDMIGKINFDKNKVVEQEKGNTNNKQQDNQSQVPPIELKKIEVEFTPSVPKAELRNSQIQDEGSARQSAAIVVASARSGSKKNITSRQNESQHENSEVHNTIQESSVYTEDEDDDLGNPEDYLIVPVNDLDKESMHIKIITDEEMQAKRSEQFQVVSGIKDRQEHPSENLADMFATSNSAMHKDLDNKNKNASGGSTVTGKKPLQSAVPITAVKEESESSMNDVQADEDADLDLVNEDTADAQAKELKGGELVYQTIFGEAQRAKNTIVKPDSNSQFLAEPNYAAKRQNANYKKYSPTFNVNFAHADKINCLCSIKKGIFMTGSNDKTIKVWQPHKQTPMASLEEEDSVTNFIVLSKTNKNDINVIYTTSTIVNCLSIKHAIAIPLIRNDKKITAITQVEQNPTIISFGLENGVIKDYDVKSKHIVRRANMHEGASVTSMVSKGKYLISADAKSTVIFYDYMSQQELRTLDLGVATDSEKLVPRALLLSTDAHYLTVGTDQGLIIIEIASSKLIDFKTQSAPTTCLKRLNVPSTDDNKPCFVVTLSDGKTKIFRDGNNIPNSKGDYGIDEIKCFKASAPNTSTQFVETLPNGALVEARSDKSIHFLEEKKSSSAANCACCNIF